MTTWLLFVLVLGHFAGQNAVVFPIEFATQAQCEQAARQVKAWGHNAAARYPTDTPYLEALCIERTR